MLNIITVTKITNVWPPKILLVDDAYDLGAKKISAVEPAIPAIIAPSAISTPTNNIKNSVKAANND